MHQRCLGSYKKIIIQSTVPLDTLDNGLEVVGGKGRSLSRLLNAGYNVPGGFQVPTSAYRKFVEENNLRSNILGLAKPAIGNGTASFEQASQDIAQLFRDHALSTEMRTEISAAYDALSGAPAVAVRSSANAEDLPELSFAGQQETYLNVTGSEEVAAAVKNCWASLWTSQAISYRHENDIDHASVAMAVVVQVMVPSDVSGILFTANPTNGERSEMIVNCSFGLGEAVVSGQVTPDTYIVDRQSLAVKETVIGAKDQRIVSDGDQGTRMEDVPEVEKGQSSLSEGLLRELSELALSVEQEFDGVPQDIEWAVSEEKLHLLQARPITNLPPQPMQDVSWPEVSGSQLIKRMAAEVMPEPLSPLFEDLYLRALFDTQTWPEGYEYKGSQTRNFLKNFVIATVNGYAYTSIPIDGHKDWESFIGKVREEVGDIPWYRWLQIIFNPKDQAIEKGIKPGIRFLLMDPTELRHQWVFTILKWWRMLRRSDGVKRWGKVDLPTYLEGLERWQSLEPATATNEELLHGIRDLTVVEARYWHVLRRIIGAAKGTDMALQMFCEENAPNMGFASGTFLSGFKSKVVDAEMDMRVIAEQLRNNPRLYELTITTPAARFLRVLKEHPEGEAAHEAIDRYLNDYGLQVFNLDFAEPSLREAPLPFVVSLKALIRDSGFDVATRQNEVAKNRRAKWIEALKFFKGRKRIDFLRIYNTARINYPTREAAIFYMGKAWSLLRPFALELGTRLTVLGTIAQPDDIFYLTNDELQLAIAAAADGRPVAELVEQALAKRTLREQRQRLVPLPAVPPENKLGWAGDSKTFDTVKINDDDADILSGFAVSPGSVTGPASVIMSPNDFSKMKPDSILVCPLTTPAWTQLFPHATGLVTDIGSITAHGSIVAREYGIPAVLGTGNGTQVVKDGQMILVDGDKGIVTILEE